MWLGGESRYGASWLRHCAISRKVVGSIPVGVGTFYWHNPSGRTVALGSTQPLTELSAKNITWGWKRLMYTADNLTTFMCRLSWNLVVSTSWKSQGLLYLYLYLLQSCYRKLWRCACWKHYTGGVKCVASSFSWPWFLPFCSKCRLYEITLFNVIKRKFLPVQSS